MIASGAGTGVGSRSAISRRASHPALVLGSGLLTAFTGTSRFRLPPASTALLGQGGGDGLSPPLGQQAPHGAHSGKHKSHGLLFLALTDEEGNLIWISSARPGRSSEITTAHHDKLTAHLREAGPGAPADLGFVGLDDGPDDHPVIITGRKAIPPGTTGSPTRRKGANGASPDRWTR